MTAAIEARGVTVRHGTVVAVDRVSFDVPHASWFGVIGANGSGKTSLLRALSGRLRCEMDSCRLDGREMRDAPHQRARHLGFMVPAELLPNPLTCAQIFSLIEPDRERWRHKIGAVWPALAIDRLLPQRLSKCSAGMRQRIAIGAALLSGRGTVILDEPFNWLDPVAALDLRNALRAQVDSGLTLITALHDMVTLSACDSGFLLGKGKIIKTLGATEIASGRVSLLSFEQHLIEELRSQTLPD